MTSSDECQLEIDRKEASKLQHDLKAAIDHHWAQGYRGMRQVEIDMEIASLRKISALCKRIEDAA
jgi:hypothetical protein